MSFQIFCGKKVPRKNPPGKSPAKSSRMYTTKNTRHISAEGPGQHLAEMVDGAHWQSPGTKGGTESLCEKSFMCLFRSLENSAERAIFAKFQAPKFEDSEPEKLQDSIPPAIPYPPTRLPPKFSKRVFWYPSEM